MTDLRSGQTANVPLERPLAASVDTLRGLLFFSTKQGVFRRNLLNPGLNQLNLNMSRYLVVSLFLTSGSKGF